MNVLKLRSKGPLVAQVQERLNQIYEEQLKVDGVFGHHTAEMVMAFQEDWNDEHEEELEVDGVVGPATFSVMFGEEPADTEADTEEEPEDLHQRDLEDLFGTPRDPAPYLTVISLVEFKPGLAHVVDFEGNPWGCKVYGHRLMEAPLKRAFKALIETGAVSELETYDGCTCVRPMTGGGGWSVHSWGLAIDFNAGTNAYGHRPTLSTRFVKCFTDAGFEWGGRWRTPDGMHFQLPSTA
jgi:hypothetical protein